MIMMSAIAITKVPIDCSIGLKCVTIDTGCQQSVMGRYHFLLVKDLGFSYDYYALTQQVYNALVSLI